MHSAREHPARRGQGRVRAPLAEPLGRTFESIPHRADTSNENLLPCKGEYGNSLFSF